MESKHLCKQCHSMNYDNCDCTVNNMNTYEKVKKICDLRFLIKPEHMSRDDWNRYKEISNHLFDYRDLLSVYTTIINQQ